MSEAPFHLLKAKYPPAASAKAPTRITFLSVNTFNIIINYKILNILRMRLNQLLAKKLKLLKEGIKELLRILSILYRS